MPSTAVDFEEEDMGPGLLQSGEALLRELHAMQHPTVDVLELVEQQRDTVAASRDREKAGMDRLLDVLSGIGPTTAMDLMDEADRQAFQARQEARSATSDAQDGVPHAQEVLTTIRSAQDKVVNVSDPDRLFELLSMGQSQDEQMAIDLRKITTTINEVGGLMNRACYEAEELRDVIVEKVEESRVEENTACATQESRLHMAENVAKKMEREMDKFTGAAHASADKIVEASTTSTKNLCNNINVVSGNVSAVVHTADLNGKVRTLTEQVRLVKKLMKDGNNLKALEARVVNLRAEVAQRQAATTADGFLKEIMKIQKRGNVTMDFATARLHLTRLEWNDAPGEGRPLSAGGERPELPFLGGEGTGALGADGHRGAAFFSPAPTATPADALAAKRLAEDAAKALLLFGNVPMTLEVVVPGSEQKANDRALALLGLIKNEGIHQVRKGAGVGRGIQCYIQLDVYDPEDIEEPASPKADAGGGGKGGKGAAKAKAAPKKGGRSVSP